MLGVTFDLVTAVHEAGHAWAYWQHRLPLRYVTLRPRERGLSGICRPWRPRSIQQSNSMLIAAAGPVAEAMHSYETDDDGLDWEDHLFGAVLAGGHGDLELAGALLDADNANVLRQVMTSAWPAITSLAALLVERGTVTGREAFATLAADVIDSDA